jgi:hypothetical protein
VIMRDSHDVNLPPTRNNTVRRLSSLECLMLTIGMINFGLSSIKINVFDIIDDVMVIVPCQYIMVSLGGNGVKNDHIHNKHMRLLQTVGPSSSAVVLLSPTLLKIEEKMGVYRGPDIVLGFCLIVSWFCTLFGGVGHYAHTVCHPDK